MTKAEWKAEAIRWRTSAVDLADLVVKALGGKCDVKDCAQCKAYERAAEIICDDEHDDS